MPHRPSALPLGLALAMALPGLAAADGHAGTEAACGALADLKLDATNLLSAAPVPAADGLPPYCRVLGYVRPAINFELRLPTEGWNGKFYMSGCGGFCGSVGADTPGQINAINHALARGYAAATTDGGHWGAGSADARWAQGNPVAEVDWGSRAIEETTRVAKALTETFYAGPPERSYFMGCSTGGRQAHMAALRIPDAFDGIVSGAPALDYTALVATHFAWIAQANTGPDGAPILTPADAPVIAAAVSEACDAVDGVEDGLISAPAQCSFDPATLDLAPEKIAVLEAWYAEPVNSTGEVLHPAAVPLSSEPYWGLWLTGFEAGGGALVPNAFGPNFIRYMAFPDDPPSTYSIQDFDFDTDPARMAPMAAIYNADTPDLTAFQEAGGKLLAYHGMADAIVFPGKTVDYFEKLTATHGDATAEFARLFLVPGMDHCGILNTGPGPDQHGLDPLTALEAWVENGETPASLPISKIVEGETQWSRPACAWPGEASFPGDGDWRDPAGWSCPQ